MYIEALMREMRIMYVGFQYADSFVIEKVSGSDLSPLLIKTYTFKPNVHIYLEVWGETFHWNECLVYIYFILQNICMELQPAWNDTFQLTPCLVHCSRIK